MGAICICLIVGISVLLLRRGTGSGQDQGEDGALHLDEESEEGQVQETEEAQEREETEETEEAGEKEDSQEQLVVHFIDVGQGDATLLTCGGEAMLLDTGSADPEARRSERDLLAYLEENGVERLDYLLLTHGHEDHMGRACDVLEAMEVDKVLCDFGNQEGYVQRLEQMLEDQEMEVIAPQAGQEYPLGEAVIHIVTGRLTDLEDAGTETGRVNNQSIGVKVTYGENSFLFYGDGEAAYEKYLLDCGEDIRADVLKVPHHGAAVSCCQEILEKVSPQYAVISSAKQEDFGFPAAETLLRLTAGQITTFYTNRQGNVVAASDGETIRWMTRR